VAQSVTDLCSSALQLLGVPGIANILDNSREARQCNLAYDGCRRAELRKHRWNFAIKRAQLSADVTAPSFDYQYAYQIPSDCLRVLIPNDDPSNDWTLEGRKILSNFAGPLKLRYIADITDVSQWDPAFYDAVGVAMADIMCEAITNSNSKKATLGQVYKDTIHEARRNNAFEQRSAEAPEDSYWLVRY